MTLDSANSGMAGEARIGMDSAIYLNFFDIFIIILN
jgi:hypothetical protein